MNKRDIIFFLMLGFILGFVVSGWAFITVFYY